ncbi:hypothetical protein J437_LFUL002873 [Ladona fulva]|uniref:Uncharacterized protein n=1 Tax=Ladona fulva TaxID=123851 RepID=A0A8K0P906_LADFU|nr:hypothetical protein J437_LFUL002873 [Ladona fulva]
MDVSRDEAKPSQKQEYLCCNSDCNSKSSNFTIAPRSTVKYYQATNHGKRTQYVCEVCLKEYMTHTEKMVSWALEKKPLFLFKMPEQKETVLITDSDEESEGNDDQIIEDVPLEIEDDLQEVIKGIVERIDLKSQYEGGEKILLDDMSDLKDCGLTNLILAGAWINNFDI